MAAPRKEGEKRIQIPVPIEQKKIDLLGRDFVIQLSQKYVDKVYNDRLKVNGTQRAN